MTARYTESEEVSFRSADGIAVQATLLHSDGASKGSAVLVHGITEDRDEACGFYSKLADHLALSGFDSLRFDLRAHGASKENYENLTLFNALSDIHAAVAFLIHRLPQTSIHLVGTSFGGGLSVLYASRYSSILTSLVLLCPNLDYRRNWIERKTFWANNGLTDEGVALLAVAGTLPHGEFQISRCMFHELLHVRPFEWMTGIGVPCLTVHGTADSIVPHDLSVKYFRCNEDSRLLLIEGADHGFAEPGDETFTTPATQANLDRVFNAVGDWLGTYSKGGRGV